MKNRWFNRLQERLNSAVLKQQFLSYFLAALIFFQSIALYSQYDQHRTLQYLQHQSLLPAKGPQHQDALPNPIEIYNHEVPLRIDPGSFSAAPGDYMYPLPIEENQGNTPENVLQPRLSNHFPIEGQDYILDTKIGHAIENLQNHNVMVNQIYRLHNALIAKLQGYTRIQLEDLIRRRSDFLTVEVDGIEGIAELTQVDDEFMIRVVHGPTEVAFYILDKNKFSEDSRHFKRLLGRQRNNSGHSNRLDNHQRGRHVIYLWRDGSHNTRTLVKPFVQKRPEEKQTVLPIFEDPQQLQQAQRLHTRLYDNIMGITNLYRLFPSSSPVRQSIRENRRLRAVDYWNAIYKPPDLNSISFGIAKAIFQGALAFLLVKLRDPHSNAWPASCVVGGFSLGICSLASSYIYWTNMGGKGFFQLKEHKGFGKNLFQQIKDGDIDWTNTLKSRVARTSYISLVQSWLFLYVTDPRAENITGLLDALLWLSQTFLFNSINVIASNSNRTAWNHQAELNEQAGLTNGRQEVDIPPLPPISWNQRNTDYLFWRYIPYDIGRIFHLLNIPIPILTPIMSTYVFDLDLIGVNAGLFAIGFLYLLGNLITLRYALKYHYENFLNGKQTWGYLDNLTKGTLTGGPYLRINRRLTQFLSWFHSRHFPRELRDQLEDVLLNEDAAAIEDLHLESNEKDRFERWRSHAQRIRMWDQEIALRHGRHAVDKRLVNIENAFIQHLSEGENPSSNQEQLDELLSAEERELITPFGMELLSPDNLMRQVTPSFKNIGKVLYAFSETLKSYYFHTPSSPVYQGNGLPNTTDTDYYAEIWERNKNVELWDILIFFKDQLTEEFPHLKTALDIVTNDIQGAIQIEVERLKDEKILNIVLGEFEAFVEGHHDELRGYIEEQEVKRNNHRNGGLLRHKEHPHNFNFDLNNRRPVCIQALTRAAA